MDKKRIITVLLLTVFSFTVLSVNLFFISDGSKVSASITGATKTSDISQIRGNVYDCNGEKLVNRQTETYVVAKPCTQSADTLKNYLTAEQYNKLISSVSKNIPFCEKVKAFDEDTDYVKGAKAFVRYEKNQLACHIIGYINSADNVGVSGIEKSFDKWLTEDRSTLKFKYSADAHQNVLKGDEIAIVSENYYSQKGVKLTLDRNIQKFAEDAMKLGGITSGACVVLEAESGEVKAMASTPVFDPSDISKSLSEEGSPFINRALTAYSVGSVFKSVTSCAAIKEGYEDFTYNCTGSVNVGNRVFSCSGHKAHGKQNMSQALANSCNTYFVNLALKTGSKPILDTARSLGFGEKVNLAQGISSEAGYLPDENDISSDGELANLSFGQGKLMATPLQVAQCYGAMVSDGELKFAALVKSTVDTDGNETPNLIRQSKIRALTDEISEKMIKLISDNFSYDNYETARPDYECLSGGKTSTAQTGWFDEKGEEILHSWFSGFVKIGNETYVITVFKENGVSGAEDCAPVFREIANRLIIYKR